jgi:osmotically inducible lipoprotein OsmB
MLHRSMVGNLLPSAPFLQQRFELEDDMRKTFSLLIVSAAAFALTACGHTTEQRAASGAVAGAVVGGPVGAAAGAAVGTGVSKAKGE